MIPMKIKLLAGLSLYICLLSGLAAQIAPPDFLCIRNDSIFWMNDLSACGPYQSTSVFRATNAAGPFAEIQQINDPAAVSFLDPNPGGELRYYFLRYNYDCPGVSAVNSDTLNNLIPLPPSAIWVSVEDSTVVVNWTASSSGQTSGYRVFRREPQGLVAIATVSGAETTTYVDASFTSQPVSEAYAVAAIDPCGSQSLLTSEAITPLLTTSGGSGCEFVITLTSDAAGRSSLPLPINSWHLLVSTNGSAFVEEDVFGGGNTSITYDGANDGDQLCFYLEGLVQGQANRPLRTPIECIDVDITQPVRPFTLLGGGFDPAGNFCFDFAWDSSAAVDLLQAEVVDAGSQSTATLLANDNLSDPLAQTCLTPAELPDENFSLNLRAEDVCDNIVITNRLNPVFLSGQTPSNGTNLLNWTAFTTEEDISVTYRLERTTLDGTAEIIYSGEDLTHIDLIEPTDANRALSCYRVLADVSYADGSFSSTYASETVCLEQQPMIYLPNVFSSSATQILNREFCPNFARLPTGAYQFDIWDRWGGHVFSTTDPATCWRGDYRGRLAETGVYLYVLRLEIGGRTIERSGDVTFLR
ncbi:hypothetical protein CEQ90_12250 [Lewinellaceae bacterium SD302]|nr:hypothetical protein CEQ90_12250 [Lewinellaceae bacterium SD302]